MNPLKILLMGSKELAALKLSEAGQILIYVVYGAIILAFAGAFVRIYKEFGLGKIVQAIREGRDPVKKKAFNDGRKNGVSRAKGEPLFYVDYRFIVRAEDRGEAGVMVLNFLPESTEEIWYTVNRIREAK